MAVYSWQQRRSDFNHDWLKNRYLPALWAWERLLGDEIEDDRLAGGFLVDTLPAWEPRYQELTLLLQDLEEELSPRVMFKHHILSRCRPETKEWLGLLIHALWLARMRIPQRTDDVRKEAKRSQEAYDRIRMALGSVAPDRTVEHLQSIAPEFKAFRQACTRLTKAIEQLPSRIHVT